MKRRAFLLAPVSALLTSESAFLQDLSRRSLQFFLDQADPQTGLIRDRARTDGEPSSGRSADVASIAGTGFSLTAFCIAAERQWIERREAERRVVTALRFLRDAANVHGWYYHFLGMRDGIWRYNSEVSSIDTAFLLAGALTARQYFSTNAELVRLATELYDRVDFRWMLDGHPHLLSHGWYPERGLQPLSLEQVQRANGAVPTGDDSPYVPDSDGFVARVVSSGVSVRPSSILQQCVAIVRSPVLSRLG
jgi:hypothetical protein